MIDYNLHVLSQSQVEVFLARKKFYRTLSWNIKDKRKIGYHKQKLPFRHGSVFHIREGHVQKYLYTSWFCKNKDCSFLQHIFAAHDIRLVSDTQCLKII